MSAFPYPGLRAFHRDESDIFFGRDEQIDQLLDKLQHSRFLGVIGVSGCGKSSLVKAGMIAALETGFLASAGTRWQIAEMRPSSRPLKNLSEALIQPSALGHERPMELDVAFLHATLQRGPLGLVDFFRERPLQEHTNLLVLVDQFEELFRYARAGGMDEADAFVALLLTTVKSDVPVYVVVTMRSDFLGECALFMGLPEALNESQFLTPRLTRDQRAEAIVGPANVFGDKIEPALVNHLLNDMGSRPDELPLMQHVLMRMWMRENDRVNPSGESSPLSPIREKHGITITLDDYREVGGLGRALSNHADKAFGELTAEQPRIARIMFRCLSERGTGKRDTRCPTNLGTVAEVADVSWEQVADVVEVFRRPSRNFITPPIPTPLHVDTVLDIGHESLIRRWKKMNEWVEQEANSASTYRRLEETARLWKSGKSALWGAPDLDVALEWKKQETPSAAWAARYGGDFDLALEFLQRSEEKRKADEAASEAARRLELDKARAFAEDQARQVKEQKRTARRLRWLSGVLAVMFLFAVGAGFYALNLRSKTAAEKRRNFSRVLAQTAADQLSIDQDRSLLLALHALSVTYPSDHYVEREVQESLYQSLQAASRTITLGGHAAGVIGVAFTPDGSHLATASNDKTARIWDTRGNSDPVIIQKGEEFPISALAFSPDGKLLATASGNTANVIDVASRKERLIFRKHTSPISGIVFSPDGKFLATASWDGTARIWSAESAEELRVFEEKSPQIANLTFSPNGQLLVTASGNKTKIWNIYTGREVETLPLPNPISWVTFSPNGTFLAAASGNTVRIWEIRFDQEMPTRSTNSMDIKKESAMNQQTATLRNILKQTAEILSVAFNSDGTLLATASKDNNVNLFSIDGQVVQTLTGHAGPVTGVAFNKDGTRLATSSEDGFTKIWNVARTHMAPIRSVTFSADGRLLATASDDKTAKIINTDSDKELIVLEGHEKSISDIAFSPDHIHVATASHDGTVRIWDMRSNAARQTIPGHNSCKFLLNVKGASPVVNAPVLGIAFSPDGKLATAREDGTAEIWNINSSNKLLTLRGHVHQSDGKCQAITSVVFDRNGTRVATISSNGNAIIWDANSGAEIGNISKGKYGINAIAFNRDGIRLAAAMGDGTVQLLKLSEGLIHTFPHSTAGMPVNQVAFDPDGARLASMSEDGIVKIWKSDSAYERLLTLKGNALNLFDMAFSPDGKRLATAGSDGNVQLYSLDIESLKQLARSRLTRALSVDECQDYVNVHDNTHPCPYPGYSSEP